MYVANMQTYILLRRLKQVRHHRLSEPDGFSLKTDVDFHPSVFGLIYEELALLGEVGHSDFNRKTETFQDTR